MQQILRIIQMDKVKIKGYKSLRDIALNIGDVNLLIGVPMEQGKVISCHSLNCLAMCMSVGLLLM